MTVIGFDSFEEMQAHMARAENAANAMVTPEQKAITPGDYVQQRITNPHIPDGLMIMGKTMTAQEYVDREQALWIEDEDGPFDAAYTLAHAEHMIERGYIEGWWSSEWETGEWGSVHRYNMLGSVTEEEYLAFLGEHGGQPMPPVGRAV